MSSRDPVIRAHQEWLGFLQPSGLVVSPAVLASAGAQVNRNIAAEQLKLKGSTFQGTDGQRAITDFPRFTREFLGWANEDLVGIPGGPELPKSLEFALTSYGETLSPTYAVADVESPGKWLLLIMQFGSGVPLDVPFTNTSNGWNASPQARLERLLREDDIPIGLLANGTHLRLVYAPKGESTGFITFPVAAMCEVAGRPIVAALHMLLSAERLFSLPSRQRLPALLRDSRKFQNDVSTELAEQVLSALYELVRGFQAANESARGELLREVLRDDPNQVYGGLLATLLRLVFVLYAEDRDLLPGDPVWVQNYSVTGLFESLRADASRYPDTIDQRFGAWARLLTLFRMINDGARHGGLHLPARHGRLFDPDTYPFLEGRRAESQHEEEHLISPPRISDGVVHRVLTRLLLLDGERISYRALDVEQIGSVYEAMMGFEVQVAEAASIALRPKHVVVDLEPLLAAAASEREKHLKKEAGCELTNTAATALKSATSIEGLVAALTKRISPLTPGVLPKGSLYLQPTEERRRSGSHYTPRSLTQPIVKTTLEPILANLGERPRPEQILDLKVCDPAMGSGAFLVEACRFLADALVEAWDHHGGAPPLPPGEDSLLHARRLVAQRCLYGVDKNPFAVDLAKLSIWLATLAKDHPFTFLDHALRHGDSLVGLSREQIASFHWAPEKEKNIPLIRELLMNALKEAEEKRTAIHALGDSDDAEWKTQLLAEAERAVARVRLIGDAVISAFFGAASNKEREALRSSHAGLAYDFLVGNSDGSDLARAALGLRNAEKSIPAFHWAVEFPEVFSRDNGGFDAFVGNPPFLGGKVISGVLSPRYPLYQRATLPRSAGAADLVAYFFRRSYGHLRQTGCLGFIATASISEAATREVGIEPLLDAGGSIYAATSRLAWPGTANVVVSSICIRKGFSNGDAPILNGRAVKTISSTLSADLDIGSAQQLDHGIAFSAGVMLYGASFVIDESQLEALYSRNPGVKPYIREYVNGNVFNGTPRVRGDLYVVDFGDLDVNEISGCDALLADLKRSVTAERANQRLQVHETRYWLHWDKRTEFFKEARTRERILACSSPTPYLAFLFVDPRQFFMHNIILFLEERWDAFGVLQSSIHGAWAAATGSTFGSTLRYSTSAVFRTFPLLEHLGTHGALAAVAQTYYESRAAIMLENNEGLTATYNRFHNPEERDSAVARLRNLQSKVDRAVLEAYGWGDLAPVYRFQPAGAELEGAAEAPPRGHRRWHYQWADETRDEVLGRLLALNAQRAENGTREHSEPARKGRKKRRQDEVQVNGSLFDS